MQDVLFMIEDWNAKLGIIKEENVAGLYSQGNWNEAGEWQINFCQSNAFCIANTAFKQPK